MARRTLTLCLTVLLAGSWTGDLAGHFPLPSQEAQAKAGGAGKGKGRGNGSGRSNGAGRSESAGARAASNGAQIRPGSKAPAAAAAGAAKSATSKAVENRAMAASAKAAKRAAVKPRPRIAAKKSPSPAANWAAQIQRLDPQGQKPKRHSSREIVIRTRNPAALEALAAAGFQPVALKQTTEMTLFKLRLPPALSSDAALRLVAVRTPDAIASRNDLYYTAEHTPCPDCGPTQDPFPTQESSCTADVVLGLIDTRIDLSHRALQGQNVRIVKSREGAGSSPDHGTAMAALLVGKAPDGSAGLLPGATLLATDAFATDSDGDYTDAFALAAALDTLVKAGANVINLSLAGPPNEVLHAAIKDTIARGADVVASVGNASGTEGAYPAAYPDVISVTAVDTHKDIYRYANRGPFVDFAAPGVSVSIPGSDLVPVSGTSFATPFVTAAAAVVRSMDRERHATLDEILKHAAIDLGTPGRDEIFGWGMIDMAAVCDAHMPIAKTSPAKSDLPE
jgi:hypothetical protein